MEGEDGRSRRMERWGEEKKRAEPRGEDMRQMREQERKRRRRRSIIKPVPILKAFPPTRRTGRGPHTPTGPFPSGAASHQMRPGAEFLPQHVPDFTPPVLFVAKTAPEITPGCGRDGWKVTWLPAEILNSLMCDPPLLSQRSRVPHRCSAQTTRCYCCSIYFIYLFTSPLFSRRMKDFL